MIKLRDYQENSITMLYDWLRENDGNPCVVLPTGAGKSVVIAELCRRALKEFPGTTILMITRSKELIEQNAEKLRQLWPNVPMGIYSASVGKRQLGEPITIAGPLSIVSKTKELGHIDLIICDECHDISHNQEGSYRNIIDDLKSVNPHIRVIGYTATPYRLGHGLITDSPAIFDEIIEPITIESLIHKGYLSPLRSKSTGSSFDVTGVKKRGGEYIESQLQDAVNTEENNSAVVDETIKRAGDRKAWMFFCSGVKHAESIRDELISRGVSAISITGSMGKKDREKAISDFKSGKIKAVTSVNCLSTGFDHPAIDLIVMARPTLSPGVYVQQSGRGLRIAPNKTDCLVLDFAGVVATHGPITAIEPPRKAGAGGEAPTKSCDDCGEIVYASAKKCPACGFLFPIVDAVDLHLRQDDIMGIEPIEMNVTEWAWRVHKSRSSGLKMLRVTYYGALSDAPVQEYLTLLHDGYARRKATTNMLSIAHGSGAELAPFMSDELDEASLDALSVVMNQSAPPKKILYKRVGKFPQVLIRSWQDDDKRTA